MVIHQWQRRLLRVATGLSGQELQLNPRADIVLASVDKPLDRGDEEYDAKCSDTVVCESS